MSSRERTLLAFVEDPGAANAVIGLGERLAKKEVSLHLIATGAAAPFLAARGERYEPLAAAETGASVLDRVRPRAVFVGTAESPDTFAFALVAACRARRVPCAGFVDAVSCADHRWRGRTEDPLAHCPDHVLVCDRETEDAFLALGAPRERLRVCGHPQLDAIVARGAELAETDLGVIRRRVFPTLRDDRERQARIVLFCGERSTGGFDDPVFDAQFRRSDDYTLHGRGSSETRTEIVTEEVLDAVKALPEDQRPLLVLRHHPKNVDADFGSLGAEFDAVSIGGPTLDVLAACDLVVGMSSMVLVEASLLGRPTLSVVARPAERGWLPALARGMTPCVATRQALRDFLAAWADSPPAPRVIPSTTGAMDRLVTFLANLVTRG